MAAAGKTYAILGATGNCGSALVDIILRNPQSKIHAYCRNSTKLLQEVPQCRDNKQVSIFEGSINDATLLANCVQGSSVIFHTVTSNTNSPGYDVGLTVTKSIIEALRQIKDRGEAVPKVVVLSSATIDPHLRRSMPQWFVPIMLRAHSNVYNDLIVTEELLRAEESWISSIFIKPGGLSVDKQRGHALSLEREMSFVSYLDLAAGMLEAAEDPENQYHMRNVAVINTGGSAKVPMGTPLCILMGFLRHCFPWMHPYLPIFGPK